MKAIPPKKKGGRNQTARRLESKTASIRGDDSAVNTYGTHEFCVWPVGHGLFWFQTTRSDLARKLAKRRDARSVEISGLNHYRRTFEIRGTRRKILRIINRYLTSAGDQFSDPVLGQDASKIAPRVKIAGATLHELYK